MRVRERTNLNAAFSEGEELTMNGGIAGGRMSFFQSLFIFIFSQGRYRRHENEERWDLENFENFIGAVTRIALMRNNIFAIFLLSTY